MKKFLLFFAVLSLICYYGNAQVSAYSFAQTSGSYTAITGGTVLVTGTSSMDSWVSSAITIPSFTFNGVVYTTAYVTSNGILSLGTTAPSAYTTAGISSGAGGGINICPFSADLDKVNTNATTEIRWQTVSNEVIFQWTQVKRYGKTESFDFQIRLNTVTGIVTFIYKLNSGPAASSSYQPQVGIRTSLTDYNNRQVTIENNWNTSIAGTANNNNCRFDGTSPSTNFTTGQTYTFTPPPPCTAPTAQPTALNLNPVLTTQIDGSFTAASPAPYGYLVVRELGGATPTSPSDGTTYAAGNALGTGVVVSSSALTTFSATGLTANTMYDFYIYSMNHLCTGGPLYLRTGPLTGSVKSLAPSVPKCPTTYVPADAASGVLPTASLSWSGATGDPAITGYDVYFSTNQTLVANLDPSVKVSSNQAGTSYTPSPALSLSTTYYWTVVPKNSVGDKSNCGVKSFTTYFHLYIYNVS